MARNGSQWLPMTRNDFHRISLLPNYHPKAPANTLPVGAPGGPAFAFMPFGAGARTCVGQRFAILEAVVLLASIVKKFEITMPEGEKDRVREHLAVTLRPVNLRLVFKRREGQGEVGA